MKVIAAIDGSTYSDLVLEAVATRVWPAGSTIHLVSVLPDEAFHTPADTGPDANYGHGQTVAQAVTEQNTVYATQLSQIQPQAHFVVDVVDGGPRDTLLHMAANLYAELIIMACHGEKSLQTMLLGSVCESLLGHALCPVLVAKKLTTDCDSINIVVPVDHSRFSATALEWLMSQQWLKPIKIKLVHAIPPLSARLQKERNSDKAAQLTEELEQLHEDGSALLRYWGPAIRQRLDPASLDFCVVEGDPRLAILEVAHGWPAHLIIMGSHGRTGLTKYLLGSVTTAVARHAQCSVEVVRQIDLADYVHQFEGRDRSNRLSSQDYVPHVPFR
jgi:nucleotide-binding universal stress UspA family protein